MNSHSDNQLKQEDINFTVAAFIDFKRLMQAIQIDKEEEIDML